MKHGLGDTDTADRSTMSYVLKQMGLVRNFRHGLNLVFLKACTLSL